MVSVCQIFPITITVTSNFLLKSTGETGMKKETLLVLFIDKGHQFLNSLVILLNLIYLCILCLRVLFFTWQ